MTTEHPWRLSGLPLDEELTRRRRRVRVLDDRERRQMHVCIRSFDAVIDGKPEHFTAGQSRAVGFHPIVDAYRQFFAPVGRDDGIHVEER